jgi:hypothetical protein
MERNVQLSFDAKPSESASCGAVEVERWRSARGVEVPIPTTTAVFGVMPRNAPVVVANLLLSAVRVPQAPADAETEPNESVWTQRVPFPPRPETTRPVVDAVEKLA